MYKKFLRVASGISLALSVAALVLLVVLNAWEIFNRYLLSRSSYWIQDVTLLLMMWFLFFGVVKIIHDNRDIYVDILTAHLPPFFQKICSVIVNVMSLLFSSTLCYQSYRLLVLRQGRVTVTAGIPTGWYISAIIVCCALLTLIFLRNLYDIFFGKKQPKQQGEGGAGL